MTIRARSLCILAGLALALPFAAGAGEDNAKHTPPAKHEEVPAAKPAKAKPSIWDSAKAKAKPEPAAKPESKPEGKPESKPESKPDAKADGAHGEDTPHGAAAKAEEQDEHSEGVASHGEEHDDDHAAAHGKPSVNAKAAEKADRTAKTTKNVHEEDEGPVSPDAAIQMLREGNERWASGKTTSPSTDADRREDVAEHGQHPFVTVLTCADSRIPVERVFDRGVGEVFTVRVAGNVAGDSETGTIEYGVGHLKTGLLVVMGHSKCGAVAAACSGAEVHGKVAGLIQHVAPAVERAKRNNPGASESEIASLVERENVWQSVYDLLKNSDEVREKVAHKELKVVGALYDISTGKVEFLGEHPWQSELVAAMESGHQATTASTPAPAGTTMTVAVEGEDDQEAGAHH